MGRIVVLLSLCHLVALVWVSQSWFALDRDIKMYDYAQRNLDNIYISYTRVYVFVVQFKRKNNFHILSRVMPVNC